MIKVSNVRQRAVPTDEPAYMGMYFTGGNCPKSPRRITEQPPNGIVDCKEKLDVSVHQFESTFLDQ